MNEDRTDLLGIPPFWAKASINPSFLWQSWIGQFFLAAGLKDNINPHDLLTEPTEVVDEPPHDRSQLLMARSLERRKAEDKEIKWRFEELTN